MIFIAVAVVVVAVAVALLFAVAPIAVNGKEPMSASSFYQP